MNELRLHLGDRRTRFHLAARLPGVPVNLEGPDVEERWPYPLSASVVGDAGNRVNQCLVLSGEVKGSGLAQTRSGLPYGLTLACVSCCDLKPAMP